MVGSVWAKRPLVAALTKVFRNCVTAESDMTSAPQARKSLAQPGRAGSASHAERAPEGAAPANFRAGLKSMCHISDVPPLRGAILPLILTHRFRGGPAWFSLRYFCLPEECI